MYLISDIVGNHTVVWYGAMPFSGTWSKYYSVLYDRSWAKNVGKTCCLLSLPRMEFNRIG